jgi:hypothetical protein
MKTALLLLSALFVCAGCATHSREQIAAARMAGVSPSIVAKLEHDRVLTPGDIIELRRHHVPDSVPIRHLREVGVDYMPHRDDLRKMRAADVHAVVIDELIIAAQRFVAERYYRPAFSWGIGMPYYGWDPFYDYGWGYGSYSVGYYRHGGHHDHGHHHHRH